MFEERNIGKLTKTHKKIIEIFYILKDNENITLFDLSKISKLHMNTLKNNCYFLEIFGLIDVSLKQGKTNIPSFNIIFLKKGKEILNKVENLKNKYLGKSKKF